MKKTSILLGILFSLILFVPVISFAQIGSDVNAKAPTISTNSNVNTPELLDANGKPIPVPTLSCNALSPSGWIQNCFWLPITNLLASGLISIGGLVLAFSGKIFDYVILNTIINLPSTLSSLFGTDLIYNVWIFFKGISNIVIIILFIVIAMGIILGNSKFGDKKLIARALVIAILINFSLLFARMIIDASNFVAYQVYATQGYGDVDKQDLAGRFSEAMGAGNFTDTIAKINKQQSDGQGGFATIFYGLIVGLLLIILSCVFLYGSFLMVSRFLLLLVVMFTASLAFASYLIPGLSDTAWKPWWNALIQGAFFAPLLMLFLTVSLLMINTAGKLHPSASLGEITSNSTAVAPADFGALFGYILGTGFLFISFRLASSFAKNIAGFTGTSIASTSVLGMGTTAVRGSAAGLSRGTAWAARKSADANTGKNDTFFSRRMANLSAGLNKVANTSLKGTAVGKGIAIGSGALKTDPFSKGLMGKSNPKVAAPTTTVQKPLTVPPAPTAASAATPANAAVPRAASSATGSTTTETVVTKIVPTTAPDIRREETDQTNIVASEQHKASQERGEMTQRKGEIAEATDIARNNDVAQELKKRAENRFTIDNRSANNPTRLKTLFSKSDPIVNQKSDTTPVLNNSQFKNSSIVTSSVQMNQKVTTLPANDNVTPPQNSPNTPSVTIPAQINAGANDNVVPESVIIDQKIIRSA